MNREDWKQGMLSEITNEYPALGEYPWHLVEGDPSRNMGGGYLEFYLIGICWVKRVKAPV